MSLIRFFLHPILQVITKLILLQYEVGLSLHSPDESALLPTPIYFFSKTPYGLNIHTNMPRKIERSTLHKLNFKYQQAPQPDIREHGTG